MTIAATLKAYLDQRGVAYEIVTHSPAASSLRIAEAAYLPGHRLAKAVVVGDEQGHLVVVVPAPSSVDLGRLHRQFGRRLGLVTEPEVAPLFSDCEPGVVPALGQAAGWRRCGIGPCWKRLRFFLKAAITRPWCGSLPRSGRKCWVQSGRGDSAIHHRPRHRRQRNRSILGENASSVNRRR